jgi:hypothetical protein
VIELIITLALIPIVTHVVTILYNGSLQNYALVTIGMFLFSSLYFVGRFALLSIIVLKSAVSMLIAFVSSSIPSVIWSERISMRYICNSAIAVVSGFALGYAAGLIFDEIHPGVQVLISAGAALAVILALGNTSTRDIGQLVREILKKS